jgi:hypothetical protein
MGNYWDMINLMLSHDVEFICKLSNELGGGFDENADFSSHAHGDLS